MVYFSFLIWQAMLKNTQDVKIRGSFFLSLEYHFGVFSLASVALQDDTGTFSLTSSRYWRHSTRAEVNQKRTSLLITERSYCPHCLPWIQYRSGEHQTVTQLTCQCCWQPHSNAVPKNCPSTRTSESSSAGTLNVSEALELIDCSRKATKAGLQRSRILIAYLVSSEHKYLYHSLLNSSLNDTATKISTLWVTLTLY